MAVLREVEKEETNPKCTANSSVPEGRNAVIGVLI
jgi:hypothetical protein